MAAELVTATKTSETRQVPPMRPQAAWRRLSTSFSIR